MKKFKRRLKYYLILCVTIIAIIASDYITVHSPHVPELTEVVATMHDVSLTWSKVTGVKSYQVKRIDKTNKDEHYTVIATVQDNHYVDQTVEAGHTYKYQMKANKGSIILKSKKRKAKLKDMGIPEVISQSSKKGTVTLTFTTEPTKIYQVLRKTADGYEVAKEITADGTSASFTEQNLKVGSTSTYALRRVRYSSNQITSYLGDMSPDIAIVVS